MERTCRCEDEIRFFPHRLKKRVVKQLTAHGTLAHRCKNGDFIRVSDGCGVEVSTGVTWVTGTRQTYQGDANLGTSRIGYDNARWIRLFRIKPVAPTTTATTQTYRTTTTTTVTTTTTATTTTTTTTATTRACTCSHIGPGLDKPFVRRSATSANACQGSTKAGGLDRCCLMRWGEEAEKCREDIPGCVCDVTQWRDVGKGWGNKEVVCGHVTKPPTFVISPGRAVTACEGVIWLVIFRNLLTAPHRHVSRDRMLARVHGTSRSAG